MTMAICVTYGGTGGTRTPTFWSGGTVPPLFGRMTEKITATFPHQRSSKPQENVWRLGVGAHIAPAHRPI